MAKFAMIFFAAELIIDFWSKKYIHSFWKNWYASSSGVVKIGFMLITLVSDHYERCHLTISGQKLTAPTGYSEEKTQLMVP